MDVVSNSPITAEEFNVWKEGRRRVKAPIISKSQCTERRARVMKIAHNHKVTTSGEIRRLCGTVGGSINAARPFLVFGIYERRQEGKGWTSVRTATTLYGVLSTPKGVHPGSGSLARSSYLFHLCIRCGTAVTCN